MPTKTVFASIFIASFGFAGVANAQDAQFDEPMTSPDPSVEPAPEGIALFDVDGDGALDREEYVSLIVTQANEGDEAAKAIVLSGDYETSFQALDTDVDGRVTQEEHEAAKSGAMEDGFGDGEPSDMELEESADDGGDDPLN